MQFESRFVDVKGTRTHYHDVGSGDPVIFLHGGGPGASGASNYRRNIASLSAGRRAVVVDLPGFGQTDNKLAPGAVFEAMGGFMRDFMDAVGIEKASFVGNSMGGGTALNVALRAPQRVERLVLMGAGGGLPIFSPMPTEGLRRMAMFYAGDGPSMEKLRSVIEMLVFDPSAITPELMEERLKAASRPDVVSDYIFKRTQWGDLWREDLSQLQHPTLLIWGREDRVVPLDAAFILLKLLPHARLHVLPNCGHWAQWEKAEEFNALVGNFLAGT